MKKYETPLERRWRRDYLVVLRKGKCAMGDAKYTYTLDGKPVETSDPVLTGRDIRSKAGLVPASDYVIIEIGKLSSRSLGLEEELVLRDGCLIELRSFASDRVFSFTINECGFEWGSDEIGAADIRRYGQIPDDHELVLDSKGDELIPDDGVVCLNPKGVERIRSRPAMVRIFINTREEYVEPGNISFKDLIALAFPDTTFGPNFEFTVGYRKGDDKKPEGSLVDKEDTKVVEGMIINVTATDKS